MREYETTPKSQSILRYDIDQPHCGGIGDMFTSQGVEGLVPFRT